MSTEDFLAKGLSQLDEKLKERVAAASARGNVLRYVCVVENLRLVVVYLTNILSDIFLLWCVLIF